MIVGGEGTGEFAAGGGSVKASLLEVDGILYVTMPDNAWAMDARDGRELWHYFWKTKGGTHIGNRGVGMWHNYLFMETPDNYIVSLDAKTGKERWHKTIAELDQGYFSTPAPVVINNHVIVGTGNDIDAPGFLQSFDPETGDLQWKTYMVPMKKGDPGLDTWPSLDAARQLMGTDLDSGCLRSEHQSIRDRHRKSHACVHHWQARGGGRHPAHLRASRACQRRFRQDGLVLPDIPA